MKRPTAPIRPEYRRKPVRVDWIIDRAVEIIGVDFEDLYGDGRHERVVCARAIITRMCREFTCKSYPEIAKELHRPNHSTVCTSEARLHERLARGRGNPWRTLADGRDWQDILDEVRAAVSAEVAIP